MKSDYSIPGMEDLDKCWMNPNTPECKTSARPSSRRTSHEIPGSEDLDKCWMNPNTPKCKPGRKRRSTKIDFDSMDDYDSSASSPLLSGYDSSFDMPLTKSRKSSKSYDGHIDMDASITGMTNAARGIKATYESMRNIKGNRDPNKPDPTKGMSKKEKQAYKSYQELRAIKSDLNSRKNKAYRERRAYKRHLNNEAEIRRINAQKEAYLAHQKLRQKKINANKGFFGRVFKR